MGKLIIALVLVVVYLAVMVCMYQRCANTTCEAGLAPRFLIREGACLCVGRSP